MRGLTPEERALLADAALPVSVGPYTTDAEEIIFEGLAAQGRARVITLPDGREEWTATPAGREALRLDAMLRARSAP